MRALVPYHLDNCWCNLLLLFVYIPFPIYETHMVDYPDSHLQTFLKVLVALWCWLLWLHLGSKQKGKQEGEGNPDASGWLPLCSVLNFVNRTVCVWTRGYIYVDMWVQDTMWAFEQAFPLYLQQVLFSFFFFLFFYCDLHVSAAFIQGEWTS